jgi:hypothetical protein
MLLGYVLLIMGFFCFNLLLDVQSDGEIVKKCDTFKLFNIVFFYLIMLKLKSTMRYVGYVQLVQEIE